MTWDFAQKARKQKLAFYTSKTKVSMPDMKQNLAQQKSKQPPEGSGMKKILQGTK